MLSGPRRIAYVDHALDLGGAEQSLIELLPHISRCAYEPLVLHADGAPWVAGLPSDVARQAVPASTSLLTARRDDLPPGWTGSSWQWYAAGRAVWALRGALGGANAAVVHTNTLKSHLLAGAAARLAGRRLVWHVRDILPPGPALRWLLRAAHHCRPYIIAISRAVAKQFAPLAKHLRCRVIYNGVPMDKYCPGPPAAALAEELGIRPDDEIVAVVGRLTPWKGHRALLQAMQGVRAQRPRARLLVVGTVAFWEQSYADELREQAAALGLDEAVIWAGFRSDVADLLRLCDIFVLPSCGEPFGRALVEAMATAKPVVGIRSGGVPEVVSDGESGLLVEPGDTAELANAIVRLLAEPALARDLGEAAWRRANRHFAVSRVAREVEEVYEDLLA